MAVQTMRFMALFNLLESAKSNVIRFISQKNIAYDGLLHLSHIVTMKSFTKKSLARGACLFSAALCSMIVAPQTSDATTLASSVQQPQDVIKGRVVDATTGAPLSNVYLVVKGTGKVALTDAEGTFSLEAKPGATVVVSVIGYEKQTLSVQSGMTISLKEMSNTFTEAVVVGFGTQKKVNLTGAVATVSAKELESRPVNSVTDALQGLVPGMNIVAGNGGGQLDATRKFNIRGTGTIGAGSSVSPLVLIDGMDGDINTLNPQDVESISVLKDAAASSIYGSRAAGGVILITTKRGKEGRVQVNYNNSFRFSSPLNLPEMANSYEHALYFNTAGHSQRYSDEKIKQILAHINGSTDPTMYATKEGRWEIWDNLQLLPSGNTDWFKTHFGNSFAQEHNVSVTGGSEKMQYYFSANYLGQDGMLRMADDKRNRYSVMGRINGKLASWARFGYTARFNRTDYEAPSFMDNLFYHNIARYWPIIPLTDPNGFYSAESKVYQLRNGGIDTRQRDRLSQQLSLTLEPIKNWLINAEVNYRTGNTFEHKDWQHVYVYDVNKNPYIYENQTSSVYEYGYKENYFNPNIYTSYERAFGEHNAKLMLGYQSEWLRYRNLSAQRDGILSGIPTINTTGTNPRVGGGLAEWSTAGFFGRLNYDYKGRYLFEGNFRYDGSSRFIRKKRWNWFPSFSLGWNVSQETFFEPLKKTVNNLKMRFSWGLLGNQNTDNWYPFYTTMGYAANGGGWLVNGEKPNVASEPSLVSALLTWEKTRTWNLGFDLGMFDNKLTATFDYFQRKTYDMVGPAPELPDVLGAAVPKVNNLDMTSRGWELMLSWRDRIQDFRYGIALSLSDNQVTIDKYPNEARNIGQTYYVGAHLGDIWGFETVGIAKTDEEMNAHLAKADQSQLGANWTAGDIMYRDLDGDNVISIGENTVDKPGDRRIIGNSTPRYNFGLNLDAAWKGFDLKVFFQGVLKRDYWANGNMFWGAQGGLWQSTALKEHLNYFRSDANDPLGQNLDAYYPRPDWTTGKNQYVQTRYLQNAAYARLKNITLGYTLPESITQRFYCQSLRFFVSAENLLTITSFTKTSDPELIDAYNNWGFGKYYPLSKTISLGMSITF